MSSSGEYAFFDHKPAQDDMAEEIVEGLRRTPKAISPKYFYDAKGSALFEQITELDEYYPTRTEMALFDKHLPAIANSLGDRLCLIEYGSGSSKKIRKLLEAITPVAYVPVDISNQHLQENARELHDDFPTLRVYPVCADLTQTITVPAAVEGLTKVGFFPGSSIGNFDPEDAKQFLQHVRQAVGEGGALIVGVDRKKSVEVLEAAYDDAAGVTAQFNLNVLSHINDELNTDFELDGFEHLARYNKQQGCIQMFLVSKRKQTVTLGSEVFEFAAGEQIHTENSYKYDSEEFALLAGSAGFSVTAQFSDAQEWFSLFLLRGC